MTNIEFNEADHSIFELLSRIRNRPAIFLDGDTSIKRLRSFIVGYDCGLGSLRFALRDHAMFGQFNDWVAAHLGFRNSTSGWCNMILEKSDNDDANAYFLFFELLDQFCKETGIKN
jgi:hypothetical protein